jgi:hypothetical protein
MIENERKGSEMDIENEKGIKWMIEIKRKSVSIIFNKGKQ